MLSAKGNGEMLPYRLELYPSQHRPSGHYTEQDVQKTLGQGSTLPIIKETKSICNHNSLLAV